MISVLYLLLFGVFILALVRKWKRASLSSIANNRAHVGPGRICPGKSFALRTVYLAVACILSVSDIGPVLDESGNPRIPRIEFYSAFIRDPKPFECTIKPRSEGATKLVKEALDRMNYKRE